MARNNNGFWKVVATIGGFVVLALGAAVAYGMLCNDVETMKPEVQLNTEHRIRFEEKVTIIEKNTELILEEMRSHEP